MSNTMDMADILKYLPHRYPFLLVDKVLDWTANESLVAQKNVTMNEPCFTGHFPTKPVMPGVLMIESLAQAAGILALASKGEKDGGIFYLAAVDAVRFKRVVVPGDVLTLNVEVLKAKRDIWKFKGTASVDGELACSLELMVAKG